MVSRMAGGAAVLGCMTIFFAGPCLAGTEILLHQFSWNSDGGFPFAGLSSDSNGNLFGTTYYGGATGGICCGTVFALTPDKHDGWNYRIIYTFPDGGRIDGEAPSAGLIADASGNVYGTTQEGDSLFGCGSVFELSPTKNGPWKETILHRFNHNNEHVDKDGCQPVARLVFDQAGNLYGSTEYGGGRNYNNECEENVGSCGTVFELSPENDGKWKETILHRFPGGATDGLNPVGWLVLDKAGNLWGTTQGVTGNSYALGTVFELSRDSKGRWKESTLYQFTGDATGWNPLDGLTIDVTGNLYGTTYNGGLGFGTVFELTPQKKGPPLENVIYDFAGCSETECADGLAPWGGLIIDSSGNLYGTTTYGGGAGSACESGTLDLGCGVLFKLSPRGRGLWNYSVLYAFPGGTAGEFPTDDSMVITPGGRIFGTTFDGGDQSASCPQEVLDLSGCGTIFEIKP